VDHNRLNTATAVGLSDLRIIEPSNYRYRTENSARSKTQGWKTGHQNAYFLA